MFFPLRLAASAHTPLALEDRVPDLHTATAMLGIAAGTEQALCK